ncbi:MAG TPA: MaoC family dehydratase N-terminal domain-containing protein [Burkholderiaceae bacterium]|nr:MaoC family dehydratase N-terminal domain-containing protein [Burkholderiaceae bacterium]
MTQTLQREFVGITDAALDELRQRIGVKIENTIEPWCYEATRDNIRHYAHGIGDDNPLWCDPSYARKTRYGDVIAPPSFLFACNRIISGYVGGLPGVHAMWAGADWQWMAPIRRNAQISSVSWLKDLVEHQTRFAGRAIQQIYHVDFYDETGTQLASADSWCFRTDRDAARESGTKYRETMAKPPRVYTQQELDGIYALYERERIRGGEPRYFEDVEVGQRLPTMAKGPMTVTGFIAYAQGWGGLYIRANKLAWQLIRKHPNAGIKNRFGIPDVPERVHWEPEFALKVGVPGAYDYGPERCSWLSHAVTNWIGDDAMLTRLRCEIRRHNPEGDLLTIDGEVTGKSERDGRIDFALIARNQDGELSAQGHASAVLPRRSN